MQKIDFKKTMASLYNCSAKEVTLVEVPRMNFLMIDGEGDPNSSQDYAQAVEALFSVAYTLKFKIKKSELGVDYSVMPLEGLWWADDMSVFSTGDKSNWKWTMMIMQPDLVNKDLFWEACEETTLKKKGLPSIKHLRFESFEEGTAAQIMHVGPFSAEGPTVEKLHQFVESRGKLSGKHHEIYLSDIRKADPQKWKTIIRQPLFL